MSLLFPRKEFFQKYFEICNSDEDFAEAGEGWGVDFNGDFCYVVENVPLEKVDMEELPEEVREEMDKYLIEGDIYAYYETEDGQYSDWRVLEDPEEAQEAGFIMYGDYEHWKEIFKGEVEATESLLSGNLDLDGELPIVMRNMKFIDAMQKCVKKAGENGEYIEEKYPK